MRIVMKDDFSEKGKKTIVIDFDREEDIGTEVIIRHKDALVRIVPDDDFTGYMILQHKGVFLGDVKGNMPETCERECLRELDALRLME